MLSTTIVMWHGGKKMLVESTAVMLCQTLRGEKNKPVNQLWQSLRGTMTTLFYCLANTEEISFHINFLCLHLFECKYDSACTGLLFLVRWSLAKDESFMRGFIFKEKWTCTARLVKAQYNYFLGPEIILFALIWEKNCEFYPKDGIKPDRGKYH